MRGSLAARGRAAGRPGSPHRTTRTAASGDRPERRATRIAPPSGDGSRRAVATTISWETLRQLAEFRAGQGCAISVYVNLDPSLAPTAGDAKTRVNSLVDGLRAHYAEQNSLTHDQREALRGDSDRIRRWFDTDFDRDGARAVGVFCSGLDNLWRTLALPGPVDDAVHLGRELLLTPLVPLVGRSDGAIVAVVSREQGRLYRLQRRPARGGRRPERGHARPARPGRLVAGALPAAHREARAGAREVRRRRGRPAGAAAACRAARDRLPAGDARRVRERSARRRPRRRGRLGAGRGTCRPRRAARGRAPGARARPRRGGDRAGRPVARGGRPQRPRGVGLGRLARGCLGRARRRPALQQRRVARGVAVPVVRARRRRGRASARSTAPRWTAAATASTSPCTRRSSTAARCAPCARARTSIPSRGSARCSASSAVGG